MFQSFIFSVAIFALIFFFHFRIDLNSLPIVIENDSTGDGIENELENSQTSNTNTVPVECEEAKGTKTKPILPKSNHAKLSVPKLLDRLKNKKCRALHTDGFNIPRGIMKKLNGSKRKNENVWQEEDTQNILPPSKKRGKKRSPKGAATNDVVTKSFTSTMIIDANNTENVAGNKNVSESEFVTVDSGETIPGESVCGNDKDPRLNLLKIRFSKRGCDSFSGSNESDHDQPRKRQKVIEDELIESQIMSVSQTNLSESHGEVERFPVPWKPRNSYTDRLYTYFTLIKSPSDTHQSKDSPDLNDASPNLTKTTSSKYMCKLCEESGMTSTPRVSGTVTCLYGINSNMKRHIETVSIMKFIFLFNESYNLLYILY